MNFNILWFMLIAFLYTGFFFLEGFDFGVGMLLPFLGRKDIERRAIINAIGPHWDGNEVWLVTAAGATFAAFPRWYATMFSGFYPLMFFLLVALIARGVSFEFRNKNKNPKWRRIWDWAICSGSALASWLLGITFANLARGIPIGADGTYSGTLWTLFNPYGLIGGLSAATVFLLSGAVFLSLKTSGGLHQRAQTTALRLWPVATLILLVLLAATFLYTDLLTHAGLSLCLLPLAAFISILPVGYLLGQKKNGWAFALVGLTIGLVVISCFAILFPRVLISSLNQAYDLTIFNASSSPYTLKVMSIVVLIFFPIILVYQAWSYWIFRRRIDAKPSELIY